MSAAAILEAVKKNPLSSENWNLLAQHVGEALSNGDGADLALLDEGIAKLGRHVEGKSPEAMSARKVLLSVLSSYQQARTRSVERELAVADARSVLKPSWIPLMEAIGPGVARPAEIARRVPRMNGDKTGVDEGLVCRRLDRMAKAGLVERVTVHGSDTASRADGRARFYRLTSAGRLLLENVEPRKEAPPSLPLWELEESPQSTAIRRGYGAAMRSRTPPDVVVKSILSASREDIAPTRLRAVRSLSGEG